MSDEGDEATETGTTTSDVAPRRPAATPASRARRIGGRPLPGPLPGGDRPSPRPLSLPDPPARPSLRTTPGGDDERPPAAGIAGRLRWLPAGLFGAAIVALLVIGMIVGHGVLWGRTTASAQTQRQQVLAAAKNCFATINSYDYRKLPAAEKAALACSTGKFTASLTTAYQKTILVQAPKEKAVQTAQINAAGITSVSQDGKQWVLLLYGQLDITNSVSTSGRQDPFGAVVTMNRVGHAWLVAAYVPDEGAVAGS